MLGNTTVEVVGGSDVIPAGSFGLEDVSIVHNKKGGPKSGRLKRWLPDSSAIRSVSDKTLTEIIYCYFRYIKKQKRLLAGKKPKNFPTNKALSEKEWKSAKRKYSRKNPILEGKKYIEYLGSNPKFKYRDVAAKFGVTKPRVSQMIALVKKLPQEILDHFLAENVDAKLKNITERRLRPLTLLESDEDKIKRFWEILK